VTLLRRDRLRKAERLNFATLSREELLSGAPALLADIQSALHAEAQARLQSNIRSDIPDLDGLGDYFKGAEDEQAFRGWALVPWARPEGEALAAVEQQLKALKLTIRVAPLGQQPLATTRCIFSGAAAREMVLVGRTY
jgi:prolyl-tRNA synthetase